MESRVITPGSGVRTSYRNPSLVDSAHIGRIITFHGISNLKQLGDAEETTSKKRYKQKRENMSKLETRKKRRNEKKKKEAVIIHVPGVAAVCSCCDQGP
jgi:hypothetical protein